MKAVASGVGRKANNDGFPSAPWSPDELADEISKHDPTGRGVDTRTVQLWFQENERGVGRSNIRWLARVFGCDDADATRDWQIKLMAAQTRLSAKRRLARTVAPTKNKSKISDPKSADESIIDEVLIDEKNINKHTRAKHITNTTLKLFTSGSPLDLPILVFSGAVSLCFLSFLFRVHDVTYITDQNTIKQIGYLWAPNWTFLFLVFMPLFFSEVREALDYWIKIARPQITSLTKSNASPAWKDRFNNFSQSYFSVFLVCIFVVGIAQWIGVRLLPLVRETGPYAVDWGLIGLKAPEAIPQLFAITLTFVAYLYMCIVFYLFVSGFIIIYSIGYDYARVTDEWRNRDEPHRFAKLRISKTGFKCAILGMLIAYVMKLQNLYLVSGSENIVSYIIKDFSVTTRSYESDYSTSEMSSPTHFSSLIVAGISLFIFFSTAKNMKYYGVKNYNFMTMSTLTTLMFTGYLIAGHVQGFSILVFAIMIISVLYSLIFLRGDHSDELHKGQDNVD